MNSMVRFCIQSYNVSLCLFPTRFQKAYGDEMKGVFVEACTEAAEISPMAVWTLTLHELHDLPVNLAREYINEIKRGFMQIPSSTRESFPHSLMRGILAFGISFTLIGLVFCLLDILLNSRMPAFGMSSFWNGRWIYVEALACGIGTAWLGMKTGKQRATLAGLAVCLGLFLLYRLLMLVTLFSNPTSQLGTMRILSVFLPFTLYGLFVGGGFAWSQREKKKVGWYALAGVLGFELGWLVMAYSGTAIMLQIQMIGIEKVVVGSLWYFAYWLVPTILYGLVIGACLGLAARSRGEKVSSVAIVSR